jgi:thymidine phosphorylase
MIYLGGKAKSIKEGIKISQEMIDNGNAYRKFLEIVELQGGDISYLTDLEKYPKSNFAEKVIAEKNGFVQVINNYEIGMASVELGAGRLTVTDKIDPKAGIIFYPKIGSKIIKGDIIAEIFTDKIDMVESVKQTLIESIKLTSKKVRKVKLIKGIIV